MAEDLAFQWHEVRHEGRWIATRPTYDEAWKVIHQDSFGASVDWQMKNNGWTITPVPAMSAELFLRSGTVAGHPKTDHISIRGHTGTGPENTNAVSVTENSYRLAWCDSCQADQCRHIAVARRFRADGRIPELEPIVEQHFCFHDKCGVTLAGVK
jgi:hypothetical protein